VKELIDFKRASGLDFGLNLYISVSGIRMFAEGWDRADCERRLFECLQFGHAHFSRIRVALEDATRTPPEVLVPIVRRLTESQVSRITLADTAGVAMPGLARSLVGRLRAECSGLSNPAIGLEWHGHNDRGMAVASSIEALDAGVNHVHGTVCGIGERNGNMSLDTFMLNLTECPQIEERYRWDALGQYRRLICDRFDSALREAYPFFGESSFASATGTHVAAICKAIEMGREDVARQLFSPPSWSNSQREPTFGISHLSGHRGLVAALVQRGLPTGDDNVRRVRELAQAVQRTLTETELREACGPR
jgi:2-isopropylmalate synthase